MSKEITKKYKKLTDIEHVIARPAIYIGSVNKKTPENGALQFFADSDYEGEPARIVDRYEVEYTPGLLTLGNELLTNSLDEYERCKNENRKQRLNFVEFKVNQVEGTFEIFDNGGIPVVQHQDYDNEWLPSMLLGSLRSGSNYTEDRGAVAGVNGVGASLVNVLSSEFKLWTSDGTNEYNGHWQKNMMEKTYEKVKKSTKRGTWVSCKIDWNIFPDNDYITDEMAELFRMRCAEIAASGCDPKKPLTVKYTRTDRSGYEQSWEYTFNHFWDFTNMFPESDKFWGINDERFKLEIGPNLSTSPGIESIAIVNGIRCDFGTHVSFVALTIAKFLQEHLKEKHKIDLDVRSIYRRFRLYSYWKINAPSFNNQMKEELVTKTDDFGFDIVIPDSFKRTLVKSDIVARIIEDYQIRQRIEEEKEIKKNNASVKKHAAHKHIFVDKLVDASRQGDRSGCTLYIVEGDSAAGAAREARKADEHGIFSLRGKFINSIYESPTRMLKNKEVQGLIQAIGLKFNEPVDPSMIRYGKIAMLTDADYDGYDIYCKLLAFFYKFWPTLFTDGYIHITKSPIVVAKRKGETKFFYKREDFKAEEQQLLKEHWDLNYIKGLGGLAQADYKEVIRNPVLEQVNSTEDTWIAMHAWFGTEPEARKQLINGASVQDVAHMFD